MWQLYLRQGKCNDQKNIIDSVMAETILRTLYYSISDDNRERFFQVKSNTTIKKLIEKFKNQEKLYTSGTNYTSVETRLRDRVSSFFIKIKYSTMKKRRD
jgi:hypothetical protein